MNDKTEQTVVDALRLAVRSAAVDASHLNAAINIIDALIIKKEWLSTSLEKANSNTEHLEQKCRSCGDELDAMRAENTKLHSWLTGVEQYRGHLDRVRFEAATLRTENERLRAVLKERN